MAKKLSLLLAAVAVLAFAIPAMASASTGLTESGSLVKTGTEIKGSSTNAVTTTSLGNLTCKEVVVFGTLETNSATAGVGGKGNGRSTTTECFLGTNKINITNIQLTSLTSTATEKGTGHAGLSFEADLPGLTCKYAASAAPVTYVSGGSSINFNKATLTATPAACGTAALDGDFTLFNNTTGSKLVID